MPHRGFKSITVSETAYKLLKKMSEEQGISVARVIYRLLGSLDLGSHIETEKHLEHIKHCPHCADLFYGLVRMVERE